MVRYGQLLPERKKSAKLVRAWPGTGAIFRGPSTTTMDARFDRGESGWYNNIENLSPWECVWCLYDDGANQR